MRAVWRDAGPHHAGRLLLTIHHLAVDAVSWRILCSDLAAAWRGEELPERGTSFRHWARLLEREARSPARAAEVEFWRALLGTPPPCWVPVAPTRGETSWARCGTSPGSSRPRPPLSC